MRDPRLESKRDDVNPKCASCRNWEGRDTGKSAAKCELHSTATLDLSVCTAWELHEIHHGQIMSADDGN